MWKSTRFIYGMYATTGVFVLMACDIVPKEHYGNAFLFLTAVAGLMGVSKAVEKWRDKAD